MSIVLLAATAAPLSAQSVPSRRDLPPVAGTLSLSGPRFGVTLLSDRTVDELATEGVDVGHVVSQFGWQFERQFYGSDDGWTVLNEWVLLAGGLDQGLLLPSVSWMIGLRTRNGVEIGVGPNLAASGAALALAGGVTLRAGVLNVPVNVAVVPSKNGARFSVLTGFTLRK
jgi:hypothetical protein